MKLETKPLWASKTLWVAVIQAVIGIVIALTTELPTVGWLLVSKSGLDALLRLVTALPLK